MSSAAAAGAAARAVAKAGGAGMISFTMTTMIGSQLSQYNECKTVDCESAQPLRQTNLQSRVSTTTMCQRNLATNDPFAIDNQSALLSQLIDITPNTANTFSLQILLVYFYTRMLHTCTYKHMFTHSSTDDINWSFLS